MSDRGFWAMDEESLRKISDDPNRKPKSRGLVRSSSERNSKRPSEVVDAPPPTATIGARRKSSKSSTLEIPRRFEATSPSTTASSAVQPPAPEPEEEKPKSGGFSFRRISRSLRIGKKSRDSEEDIPAPIEPPKTSISRVHSSESPASAAKVEPAPEKKKSGFSKFLSSLRGKKSTPPQAPSPEVTPDKSPASSGANVQAAPGTPTSTQKKSDFFKSKKGKHLWVSRYGQDEIGLTTIAIRDLIEVEEMSIKKYAIFTLSEMLLRPVTYDPFSSRSHNRDLMHRRSTFGEKFRNAFKKPGAAQHQSPLRPASSNSSLCSLFGRSLDDVLLEDRMRTGNKRLKVPLVVSLTVDYLKRQVRAPGLFRVSGSAKRIRQINEMLESGAPPDFTGAQASDVASVLKYFLRELPEPLLTFDMYHNFIDVPDLKSVEDQLLALRLLCCLLPAINREVLAELLELLALVASVADEPEGSKMNSHNLALIFAPNLLKDRASRLDPKNKMEGSASTASITDDGDSSLIAAEGEASEVLELMIDYNEHLFVLPPELRDQVMIYQQNLDPDYVAGIIRALVKHEQEPPPPDGEDIADNYQSGSPNPSPYAPEDEPRRGSQAEIDPAAVASFTQSAALMQSAVFSQSAGVVTPPAGQRFVRTPSGGPKPTITISQVPVANQPVLASPLRTVFDASSIPCGLEHQGEGVGGFEHHHVPASPSRSSLSAPGSIKRRVSSGRRRSSNTSGNPPDDHGTLV